MEDIFAQLAPKSFLLRLHNRRQLPEVARYDNTLLREAGRMK